MLISTRTNAVNLKKIAAGNPVAVLKVIIY